MSKINVVSEEYIKLQQSFIDIQISWREKFVGVEFNIDEVDIKTPCVLQGELNIDSKLVLDCMKDMLENLKKVSSDTEEDVKKVEGNLDELTAVAWVQEALVLNLPFFEKTAKEMGVAPYLPHFIAENVLRPILFNVGLKNNEAIEKISPKGVCKCCGEPVRLADLDKEGRKHVVCPRCNTSWYLKKLTCAHCNSDNHKDIIVFKLESNDYEQIHYCKNCSNYMKVVSSNRLMDNVEPAMLDLLTIHLDYLAQERLQNDEVF